MAKARKPMLSPIPVPPRAPAQPIEKDFLGELARLLSKYQQGTHSHEEEPEEPIEATQNGITDPFIDEPFVDPTEVEDRRMRSRKVYILADDAANNTHKIPTRPSACRRVFRYLQKYEIGTVKQMAATMGLEKKTIGNALAALKQVELVDAIELHPNE